MLNKLNQVYKCIIFFVTVLTYAGLSIYDRNADAIFHIPENFIYFMIRDKKLLTQYEKFNKRHL